VDQQSRGRFTLRQLLWAGGIAALVFLSIIIGGYLLDWNWTGLPRSKVPPNTQPAKTLWDWLDLLIVPIVLAIGGYLFNSSQNRATEAAAERRAQDGALEQYVGQIGELLLDDKNPLRGSEEGSEVRMLARARTLTLLRTLDEAHSRTMMEFLRHSDLLVVNGDLGSTTISFRGANLSGLDLSGADLSAADLRRADLTKAKLNGINMLTTSLTGADLSDAELKGATLKGCDLRQTILSGADLSGADLRGSTLQGAVVSDELLATCKYGPAIVPNGQKYEEWLKSRGSGEDGENGSPS
jgi:Pentapeptide repeats (8 copies)